MIGRFLRLSYYILKFVYYKSVTSTDKYYDVIYDGVQELGGLYVKLIQFICLRTEVFSREQKARFLSFYDAVKVEPLDIKTFLLSELGDEKLQSFREICDTPFASGSFAQVYKARLNDGSEVVIKVKRRNLRLKLQSDFFILKVMAKLFDLFYYQRLINVGGLIKEFEGITIRELDYKKEVENGIYFFNVYKGHEVVSIPFTFADLSTENVIVQEYVGGISLADLIRLKFESVEEYLRVLKSYRVDMKIVLTQIAYEQLLQGFLLNRVYADPHPGNIKILSGNRFAIIDFGISGEPPENKMNYYHILEILASKTEEFDAFKLGKEFLEFGASRFYNSLDVFDYYFSEDKEKIKSYIVERYGNVLEKNRDKFKELELKDKENLTDIFINVVRMGEKFNVMIPYKLFAFIRSAVIIKSYNEFLEPEFHFMRDTYKQVLSKVNKSELVNAGTLKDLSVTLEESIENVFNFVSSIAEGDMPLYLRINKSINKGSYV